MTLPATPPGWGEDTLTTFLDDARSNQFATFHNKKEAMAKLIMIDGAFLQIAEGWTDPSDFVAATFFARSHAAFRAAVSCATAGQVYETFPCLRVCLEHAGYSALTNHNESLTKVWLNRHDDADALKAVRQTFTHANVRGAIAAKDQIAAEVYERLYQSYVDFGAHPNILGVAGSMRVVKDGENRVMQIIYLHEDGPPLELAVKSSARAGVCSLSIFQHVFPDRYERTGISKAMPLLRNGL